MGKVSSKVGDHIELRNYFPDKLPANKGHMQNTSTCPIFPYNVFKDFQSIADTLFLT